MMKKAMIICNPSSGKEEAEKNVDNVKEILRKKEFTIDLRMTEKEKDAINFAKVACQEQFDVVISMGGDGTLNETINGLAEQTHRPALGIIPLGTVNDFARALHIPLVPDKAIQLLDKGNMRPVDMGKINQTYFMNIVAVGEIAEASFSVSAKQKTLLGPLAYFVESIKTLSSDHSFPVQLQHDNGTWDGKAMLILAALTNSVGGFDKAAPDAKVDDGNLKCIIIKDTSIFQVMKLTVSLLRGEHVNHDSVEYISTSALRISTSQSLCSNVDGDQGCELPLELHVLPEHIQVFVP
jgi:YegS/Rv2252/BmrU family lipid kinase